MLESLAQYQQAGSDDKNTTRRLLFDLYTAWGKPEQAARYDEGTRRDTEAQ